MSVVRLELLRTYSARAFQTSGSRRFSSGRHQQRTKFKIHVPSPKAGKARVDDGPGRGASWARQGLLWAGELAWLACVAHCLREHVLEPCTVHGPSMQPTIEHKSWLLIDKTRSWRTAPLKTAQVVLVRSPLEPGKMVVKRITGLPGDAITVRPPAWDKHNSLGIERRLEVVPEGHVWLEGDNQNNSKDSRKFGSVSQGLVEGVVCFRLWPPTGFGVFE